MHERRDRLGYCHGSVKILVGKPVPHDRHQDIERCCLVGQDPLPAAARKPPSLSDIYEMLGHPGKE